MIQEWNLAATNLHRISKRKYEVAVIPIGATEPHNFHLPQGQDVLHTTHIAHECCRRAWEKAPSVLCLPTLPYGVECNLMDFPMAIHVSQDTLNTIVSEIVESLYYHGIRKVVILNGHGGNDFKPLIRQIQCDLDVHVFQCNWWTVGKDKLGEIFDRPDDHAGQMETSVALALFPELVELEVAGDGDAPPFRFEALEKGWVSTSRSFARMNDHCACGNPEGATAERGKKYLEVVIGRIARFLIELAQSPIDEAFPHRKG
jgi:creatinine amidohydrolase